MLSFHVKFVQTDRQTDRRTVRRPDGRTDRRTTVKQYAPYLSIRGHKKTPNKCKKKRKVKKQTNKTRRNPNSMWKPEARR